MTGKRKKTPKYHLSPSRSLKHIHRGTKKSTEHLAPRSYTHFSHGFAKSEELGLAEGSCSCSNLSVCVL